MLYDINLSILKGVIMTESERKEHIYAVIKDLYREFNFSVNHLNIIREFLHDLLEVQSGKDPVYETKSSIKKSWFFIEKFKYLTAKISII